MVNGIGKDDHVIVSHIRQEKEKSVGTTLSIILYYSPVHILYKSLRKSCTSEELIKNWYSYFYLLTTYDCHVQNCQFLHASARIVAIEAFLEL